MANLVDKYLLYRLKIARDPEAFAKIYDRYVEAIYRFAFLKLPSKEDAQDITHETFTKAWQYINENNEILNIKALLYKIARNLIIDKYRQKGKEISVQSVTFDDGVASTYLQAQDSDHGAAEDAIRSGAEVALLLRKIRILKEDYRDVLSLRLVDGLSFGLIATILEKSPGNVRVIYHRALKALKEHEQRSDKTAG
ncbi:MAG: sigma-70 family RNA polymerase sigma factor [Patescibacteria group bacterium]|nr:sigma-70 family RNA polymerase sigma factor [Patescibacteria group bacterium]